MVFHALLIAATVHSKQGSMLWPATNKGSKRIKTLAPPVDFGAYMKEWRFKEIKYILPKIMEDPSKAENDDWYKMRRRMEQFHLTTKNTMFVSSVCCFDESMSAFIPRTTKTGGLPNLSFIARKPEPLGTELKVVADGLTGKFIWMEIQEGKERMQSKQFQSLGSTAACTLRGVVYSCEYQHLPVVPDADATDTIECDRKRLWLGDSWFGSVKTVANIGKMGQHACMIIKTAHTRSPKKFFEGKMADFPGGTWIVMEGRAEKEEVDLVCVGYKYNKRKVLTFVLTKGAGNLQKWFRKKKIESNTCFCFVAIANR